MSYVYSIKVENALRKSKVFLIKNVSSSNSDYYKTINWVQLNSLISFPNLAFLDSQKLQQMYCIILYQLITSNTLGTEFLLLKYFLYRFVHENVYICNQSQQPYILVIDDHSLSDYQATQLLLTRTQSFYLILCL